MATLPLQDKTRNQHFVSQSEQRLNAVDSSIRGTNQRIYSFRVIDRESYSFELEDTRGRKIEKNLSLSDLFSFDVPKDRGVRLNLEALFQRYETNAATQTEALLAKLSARNDDIKDEIIGLLASKLLNFIRNPFCVEKMLNTFPDIAKYEPGDPDYAQSYHRIISGRKPHQVRICSQLGISKQRYENWLRVIFVLLAPTTGGGPHNLYEQMIKSLLEGKERHIQSLVYQYDGHVCLLSDRGYIDPGSNDAIMAFGFNLRKNAFVYYAFTDVPTMFKDKIHPQRVQAWMDRPGVSIDVKFIRNDLPMLARYNGHVFYQCHRHFYCSEKEGIALPSV